MYDSNPLACGKMIIVFLTGLLLFSFPAGAETNGLTLGRAVQQALANHPMVRAAQNRVAEAEAGVSEARGNFMPRINVKETYMRTDNPSMVFGMNMQEERELGFTRLFRDFMTVSQTGDTVAMNDFIEGVDQRFYDVDAQGEFNSRFQIQQPIFNGGKEIVGKQMADLHLDMARRQLARIREMVTFQVLKAYLDIYVADKYVDVALKAGKSANEHVRLAQVGVKAGTVVESDLLRAKVHQAGIEEMRITAENQAELARFGFKRALGIPPNDPQTHDVIDDPDSEAEIGLPARTEAELIQQAMTTRQDLAAARLGVEMLKKSRQLEKTDYLPQVNAWFNYDFYHHDEDFSENGQSWMVGASIEMNLFNGLSTSAKVRKKTSSIAAMQEQVRDLEQQIILEVQMALRNLGTALARIETSRKAIASAEETLRIVSKRFKSGIVPFIHVTDAEVAKIQAETHNAKALYDARLASAQLELAVGKLGQYGS